MVRYSIHYPLTFNAPNKIGFIKIENKYTSAKGSCANALISLSEAYRFVGVQNLIGFINNDDTNI